MTFHRRMIERNLRSYRRLRYLPPTPAHFRAILQWCLTRSGWNHADLGSIVFNDESRFQLCPDDHRRRVWRCLGQCADFAFTIARPTSPQPGVMVRGASPFVCSVVIRGTLTVQRLVDNVLRTFCYPSICSTLALFFSKIMPDHLRHLLI
ncbi:transposable element Tc1 transposase [Trichonephila clavipes]|nr:transposable element Tc1 transposase [Trichonephila clavipes]